MTSVKEEPKKQKGEGRESILRGNGRKKKKRDAVTLLGKRTRPSWNSMEYEASD